MARLEQLLEAIDDPQLRGELEAEVASLKSRTKFGLVYERHLPETVLIADSDVIRLGELVRPKQKVDSDETFRVVELDEDEAIVVPVDGDGRKTRVRLDHLFAVKPFGEPIYPALAAVETVTRSSERPYHAVINGENFHVLQLLAYLYAGQVDCIYIDPPYNSGASDWKYNNRYVDATDSYRHSKWLSFMEKRLRVAKRLLKPDGVLIVTIDENEVHHLGVLLEELFPGYLRSMVTIVINPKGTKAVNFSRVEEYAYFVCPDTGQDVVALLPAPNDQPLSSIDPDTDPSSGGEASQADDGSEGDGEADDDDDEPADDEEAETDDDGAGINKLHLRRRGAQSSYRHQRPKQFYAILVDEASRTVVGIGPELREDDEFVVSRDGDVLTVYPIDEEGHHRVWRYGRDTMLRLIEAGQIRVGKYNAARDTYTLNHWKEKDGLRRVRTVWWRTSHDAGTHGTTLLANLLGTRGAFPFPKSVYAVKDCLDVVVRNRPNALILDFFAGSGTTLHATCMLNAADGGQRRCILVTNNEVDGKTTRSLNRKGLHRGDPEFEAHGIFESATWPRCKTAITGIRPDGSAVPDGKKYRYLDGRTFAQGYDENVEFFRLDYLDPERVEIGANFHAIHPALWLAAGARGPRVAPDVEKPFFIAYGGCYAVLFDITALNEFEEALAARSDISHLFIITDSTEAYAEARDRIGHGRSTTMLYRDYLQNFRVNVPQNA